MTVLFYVSGHGLGHASRDIEVIRTLAAREPQTRIVVRTSAPRWIFDRTAPPRVEVQPAEVDTGIVQIDSLRIDEQATVADAARFYAEFDRRADAEAGILRRNGVDLVVGDIPPLAFAAAARAGIPSVALGNFTWDWVYAEYDAFSADAPQVLPTIARAYAHATLALRLPLHGGFAPMTTVIDVPFIARRSTRERGDTRRRLALNDDRPAVVASFGGHGVSLPLETLARAEEFNFVTADAPALDAHGLSYQDVIAAVDVVVSKPGYGIVSECAANGAALLYTSRGRFREYDLLVAEMPRVLRCRFLPRPDLLSGGWSTAIAALLGQPTPIERPRFDGADVVVEAIRALRSSTP